MNKTQDIRPQTQDPASLSASPRHGFSLMEVLIAVATLALGMLFIASVFPAGLHWTTVSSERTIAAVVADEAFAKIKLIGILPFTDPNWNFAGQNQYSFESVASTKPPTDEFAYPSTPTTDPSSKRYWWSGICRKTSPDPLDNEVQVTVFISRKVGQTQQYYGGSGTMPVAYLVPVTLVAGNLQITNQLDWNKINDGYTIVDDTSGQIYRVLERYSIAPNTIRLDKTWQGTPPVNVWVVPPPVNGGRYPCIAVYQKIIRF